MAEDSQTGEVSDEDEVAEIDEDILHRESIRRRVKVGQVAGRSWFTCLVLEPDSLISRSYNQDYFFQTDDACGKSGSGFQ